MKVSFDFGHTLETHPDLVSLAKKLRREGNEVYLLSGVSGLEDVEKREQFFSRHCLKFDGKFYVRGDLEGPDDKARVCVREGIQLHFDDSWMIAESIRKVGVLCVVVHPRY